MAIILAWFVGAVAVVVLCGWLLQIRAFVQLYPGLPEMSFNTALCFSLLGCAAAAALNRSHLAIPVVPAAVVAGIGATALLQHVFGIEFWLDQMAARTFHPEADPASVRMAAQTAGLFLAASLTTLAFTLQSRSVYTVAGASIIASQGVVAVGGSLLGIDASTGWSRLTLVPWHEAICFASLGVAYLLVLWDEARLRGPLKPLEWVHVPIAFVVLGLLLSLWHWTFLQLIPMRGLTAAGGEAALVVALVGGAAAAITTRLSALAYERRIALESAHNELARTVDHLQHALSEIRTLTGLLPICAWCKRVRDDGGYWNQVEDYVARHTGAEFSHSVCPECSDVVTQEIVESAARAATASTAIF